MKPDISSFLDHLAARTGASLTSSPEPVPGAKQFFGGGDVAEVFFPHLETESDLDRELKDASPDDQDLFFTKLYEAVSDLPKPGRSYLLWVKWGHDDEADFPPLPAGDLQDGEFRPYTKKDRTFPVRGEMLNPYWELVTYTNRVEVVPHGSGSGGAGNVVIYYAPPNPTLGYPYTGDAPGSTDSYAEPEVSPYSRFSYPEPDRG